MAIGFAAEILIVLQLPGQEEEKYFQIYDNNDDRQGI